MCASPSHPGSWVLALILSPPGSEHGPLRRSLRGREVRGWGPDPAGLLSLQEGHQGSGAQRNQDTGRASAHWPRRRPQEGPAPPTPGSRASGLQDVRQYLPVVGAAWSGSLVIARPSRHMQKLLTGRKTTRASPLALSVIQDLHGAQLSEGAVTGFSATPRASLGLWGSPRGRAPPAVRLGHPSPSGLPWGTMCQGPRGWPSCMRPW